MEDDGQLHASAALLPGKKALAVHGKGRWMGPRTYVEFRRREESLTDDRIGSAMSETVGNAACSRVTGSTEISWLYCPTDGSLYGSLLYLSVDESYLASDANQLHLFQQWKIEFEEECATRIPSSKSLKTYISKILSVFLKCVESK